MRRFLVKATGLAFKWIRVLDACGKSGTPYIEELYLRRTTPGWDQIHPIEVEAGCRFSKTLSRKRVWGIADGCVRHVAYPWPKCITQPRPMSAARKQPNTYSP